MKLKEFREWCENTNVKELVNPVLNQLGGNWEENQEELSNVCRCSCGAAGGFTGFIYYKETSAFYKKHRAKIVKSLEQYACDLGEGVIEMVKNFNSLKDDFTIDEIGRALWGRFDDDLMYVYNTLAWYALEEVAYQYEECKHELENK